MKQIISALVGQRRSGEGCVARLVGAWPSLFSCVALGTWRHSWGARFFVSPGEFRGANSAERLTLRVFLGQVGCQAGVRTSSIMIESV